MFRSYDWTTECEKILVIKSSKRRHLPGDLKYVSDSQCLKGVICGLYRRALQVIKRCSFRLQLMQDNGLLDYLYFGIGKNIVWKGQPHDK